MKLNKLILSALAVVTLAACSKDETTNNGTNVETPVEDAFTGITIKLPAVAESSRAISRDANATLDEQEVNSLHIFMYDQADPSKSLIKSYDVTELDHQSDNVYKTPAFSTTKTAKYMVVALNLPSDIITFVANNGYRSFNTEAFTATLANLTVDNGFVMFSTEIANVPVTAFHATQQAALASPTPVSVDRVIAKTAMFYGSSFSDEVTDGSGRIIEMKFGWANINDKLFLVQTPDKKDPNWDYGNTTPLKPKTDNIPVHAYSTTPNDRVYSYALENTFNYQSGYSTMNDATYVSVTGSFIPAKFTVDNGNNDNDLYDFDVTTNSSGDAETFYVVKLIDGQTHYFTDKPTAEKFISLAGQSGTQIPALIAGYNIANYTYTDGLCYYHVLVNKVPADASKYDVLRNTYYKLTLNSVSGLGMPGDDSDNGKIIEEDVNISVEVSINEWTTVEEEIDL